MTTNDAMADALKLVDYMPSRSDEDFRCGSNKFSDDIWDFKGFIEAPHWNDAKFQIDFRSFKEWESIKVTIKKYIVSELLIVSFNSVVFCKKKMHKSAKFFT